MSTLKLIDTSEAFKDIEKAIEKSKKSAKFDNKTSSYSLKRAQEFEDNNFQYTESMNESQDRIHDIIFNKFSV
jgi:hypothetical protein